MQVEETQLMQYINHEVYAETKKARALGMKWIGINIYFTPSEMKEEGWIATPNVESYSSNSEESVREYAKLNNWRTYQVRLVDEILKEFE